MVILFVGSEFRRKGLDDLIPALQKDGQQLLVVGRGDNLDHYRRLVKECDVEKKVRFTGLVSQEEVRKCYAAADLVVLPSKSEAFGMSIIEGMACGKPVAVSKNSGSAAVVHDGVNGFVLENKKLEVFLSNLPDRTALRKIGRAGREVAEQYNWHKVADKYEKLFYEVAEEKRAEAS